MRGRSSLVHPQAETGRPEVMHCVTSTSSLLSDPAENTMARESSAPHKGIFEFAPDCGPSPRGSFVQLAPERHCVSTRPVSEFWPVRDRPPTVWFRRFGPWGWAGFGPWGWAGFVPLNIAGTPTRRSSAFGHREITDAECRGPSTDHERTRPYNFAQHYTPPTTHTRLHLTNRE